MAEQRYDEVDQHREETTHPKNPPNSVLSKGARRAAVWSYFVPVVVLFVVVGVALVYWANQPRRADQPVEPSEIGTTGRTDGGFNPSPTPGDTRDEINSRSGDLAPATSLADLRGANARTMTGRRVQMDDVKVDSVSGNTLWVGEGNDKVAIVSPTGAPSVQAGNRIAVSGHVEADAQGAVQVVADRVQVNK